MTEMVISLQDALLAGEGLDVDLIRYMLSDQVFKTIDCVIKDAIAPTVYAAEILDHHGEDLYLRHFDKVVPPDVDDNDILLSWMYDRILMSVCLYRSAHVCSNIIPDASALAVSAYPHLLRLDDGPELESLYSGLGDFSIAMQGFVTINRNIVDPTLLPLVSRVAACMGCVEESGWLGSDPRWVTHLMNPNRTYPKALRSFLFMVMMTLVMKAPQFEQCFDMPLATFESDMRWFTDVREDSAATAQDVYDFLEYVDDYLDIEIQLTVSASLVEGNFPYFEHIHRITGPFTSNIME